MRIIFSIILFIVLVAISTIFIPSIRNYVVKKVAEHCISSGAVKIKIGNLKANKHHIIITDAIVQVRGKELTKIEKIAVDYDLVKIWNSKNLEFAMKFGDNTTLLGSKVGKFDADVTYKGKLNGAGETNITIRHLENEIFSDLGISALEGSCNIVAVNSSTHHISNCKITDGKSHLAVEAKIDSTDAGLNSMVITGSAKELPIDLHKTFHDLVEPSDTMQYLYDNISGVLLKEGHWEINFDKEFFTSFKMKPEYVKGEFLLENIRLGYDPNFPALENIQTKLVMTGSMLDFQIPSAYSNQTLLSNARVQMDWGAEGDTNVVIDADAKGPAANLTNFIPADQMKALVASRIDLAKLKGLANSKVHMIIPIGEAKNTYDITSNISGVEFGIFDGAIILTKGNLKAVYDGDSTKIDGNGIINGYASRINFTNFMDEKSEFDNILEVKSTIVPIEDKSKMHPYNIISGSALLEVYYKNKGEKDQILAKANLMNAEFGIDKLGIKNEIGDKAYLEIKGETAADKTLPLSIKLIGGETLQIIGTALIGKEASQISLSKLIAHDTNAKVSIDMKKNNMKVQIRGKMLDLSQSNMMQFLAKNSDDTATSLDIILDKVKLKSDIYLDNFVLNIKCDNVRCYKGAMSSKVGTRDFNMDLTAKQDYEEWKIMTDNAGAILKGIGMMENVKSGSLIVNVETRRSDVKAGQTLPIAKGNFILEKFVTVDNKFLTRLISFTSVPGLMNFIRNNHDISFTHMAGEFSYKDDTLNIFNGSAEGPFMDLTIHGNVFTKERKMKVSGKVSPSKYGPGIVAKIPIIGQVFKVTPYSISDKY